MVSRPANSKSLKARVHERRLQGRYGPRPLHSRHHRRQDQRLKSVCSPEITDPGGRFVKSLETPWVGDQRDALRALFFALFTQKKRCEQSKRQPVAYGFLIIYGYNVDRTLRACSPSTQHFSKVIFFWPHCDLQQHRVNVRC